MFCKRIISIMLCSIMILSLFICAQENGALTIGSNNVVSETLVIEEGKVVSGDPSIVESGIVTLLTSDDIEANDNTINTQPNVFASAITDTTNNNPMSINPNVPSVETKATYNIPTVGINSWCDNKHTTHESYYIPDTTTSVVNFTATAGTHQLRPLWLDSGYTVTLRITAKRSDGGAQGIKINTSHSNTAMIILNGGTLNITGLADSLFVVAGNTSGVTNSTESDPLIGIFSGTLNIKYADIRNNVCGTNEGTYGRGAGLCINGGTVSIEDSKIHGHSFYSGVEGDGGGISIIGGNVTITNTEVYSNTASRDGGGIHMTGGTLTFNSGKIRNNTGTSEGGGVCVFGGTFNMSGGSINNNTIGSSGGGICLKGDNAVLNITGGAISSNTNNNGNGGGLWIGRFKTCSISNATVSDNVASAQNGGGMFFNRLTSKTITITSTTISNNKALKLRGGGLYFGDNNADGTGNMTATISNCTISGNSAIDGAGIVALSNDADSTGKVNITISGGSITGNIATGNGGGVYATTAKVTVTINSQCAISSNTAVSGGGVYIGNSAVGNISNVTFTSNSANGTGDSGNGGGIAVSSSKLTLSSSTFLKNSATKCGGGVMMYSATGDSTISGCTIGSENYANTATVDGGGIYMTATTGIILTGGSVSFNTATGSGGGIALRNKSSLTINGTSVSSNTSGRDGGGVFVGCNNDCTAKCGNGSTLTINYGQVNGNTGVNGGGIYFRNGSAGTIGSSDTTNQTVISGNTSSNSGGGIDTCFYNTVTLNANLAISGNFANGTPTDTIKHGGGGIMIRDGSTATINGAAISGNYATYGYGGGISIGGDQGNASSESITVNSGTIINGNTALLDGGGVYISGMGNIFNATGATISSNVSSKGNGGGLAIYEIGSKDENNVVTVNTVTLTGVTMRTNTALYDTPDATPKLNADGTIYTDSAGKQVYTFVATSITGNGGAIYAIGIGTKLVILPLVQNGITTKSLIGEFEGDGLYSNQAIHGGGIAILDGAALEATNVVVKYNNAVRNGGAYFVLGCGEGDDNIYPTTVSLKDGAVAGNYAQANLKYTGDLENQAEINSQLGGQLAEVGGGAVYLRGKSNYSSKDDPTLNKAIKFSVNGTTFNANRSARGGGFVVHECASLSVKNSLITGNYASALGGALFFVKTTATSASFENCDFESNYAALRGGALFIYTGGVTVDGCTFKDNYTVSATDGYGGAIMIKNTSGKAFDFVVNDSTFEANRSCYGGAISTLEAYSNATLINFKLNNCTLKNNVATQNGGAIIVGNNIAFEMVGGYVFSNMAGSETDAVSTIADGTNNENVDAKGISGAGGGIAVFGGTFTLSVNDSDKGAIYGNRAAFAGDDVFSNGADASKLTIPEVSTMDLSASGLAADVEWQEDYANGELSGLTPSIVSSVRYRQSNNTVVAPISGINTQGNYVAIALGVSVNMGTLTITKTGSGVSDDQVFLFRVIGTETRTGAPVEFTVSITGTGSVTVKDLPIGEYSVYELTDWSWRYGVTAITVNGTAYSDYVEGRAVVSTSVEAVDCAIVFDNEITNSHWLDGNSAPSKNVAGVSPQNGGEVVNEFLLPKRNGISI